LLAKIGIIYLEKLFIYGDYLEF